MIRKPETGKVIITQTQKVQILAAPAAAHHKAPLGLRTVAFFELIKGVLFLAVGLGALSLIHKDVGAYAENVLKVLHLDPAWHYCRILIIESEKVTDARLRLVALVSLTLAAIRFAEGYGLWHEYAWAEWFAVISAGVYMPIELSHYNNNPSFAGAVVFMVNGVIVIYLGYLLLQRHRQKVAARADRAATAATPAKSPAPPAQNAGSVS